VFDSRSECGDHSELASSVPCALSLKPAVDAINDVLSAAAAAAAEEMATDGGTHGCTHCLVYS